MAVILEWKSMKSIFQESYKIPKQTVLAKYLEISFLMKNRTANIKQNKNAKTKYSKESLAL